MEEKSDQFFLKSLCKALDFAPSPFPTNFIWQSKVQPRICFFAWEAAWGRVLTHDQIQKRGSHLANRCFLCKRNEETIDHLLLHCAITRVLWELLCSLFGICWVHPCSIQQALEVLRGPFVGKKRKDVWRAMPLCLFWTIWKARNKIVFEDKTPFVYFLWVETKLCIKEGPETIDFIKWLCSK